VSEGYFLVIGLGLLWSFEKGFPLSLRGAFKPLFFETLDLGLGVFLLWVLAFLLRPWVQQDYLVDAMMGLLFFSVFLYVTLRKRSFVFGLILLGVGGFLLFDHLYETALKKGMLAVFLVFFTGFIRVLMVGLRQRLYLANLPKPLEGTSVLFLLGAMIASILLWAV